ncbi:MAG: hypothetical protein EOP30_04500 [Rhodococcus sp. (in: high G+C Gram-positive bacteria)]|nr:MAG: hypothetical protein EOP30_04500 [Rhodococcus sp. (in: high G+C Gram-positive bacteria)]
MKCSGWISPLPDPPSAKSGGQGGRRAVLLRTTTLGVRPSATPPAGTGSWRAAAVGRGGGPMDDFVRSSVGSSGACNDRLVVCHATGISRRRE